MKASIKYSLIVFCACLLFLSNCKKYPDGGFLRQGPKTFITSKNGVWKLSLYEVNGIDSTHLIQGPNTIPDFFDSFLSCSYLNKKDNNDIYASSHIYNYLVKFINKNADISFVRSGIETGQCVNTSNGISCQRNIFNPEGPQLVVFKILKIRDKECILTTSLNNCYKIILTR